MTLRRKILLAVLLAALPFALYMGLTREGRMIANGVGWAVRLGWSHYRTSQPCQNVWTAMEWGHWQRQYHIGEIKLGEWRVELFVAKYPTGRNNQVIARKNGRVLCREMGWNWSILAGQEALVPTTGGDGSQAPSELVLYSHSSDDGHWDYGFWPAPQRVVIVRADGCQVIGLGDRVPEFRASPDGAHGLYLTGRIWERAGDQEPQTVIKQIWRRQADGIYVLEYELPEKGPPEGP